MRDLRTCSGRCLGRDLEDPFDQDLNLDGFKHGTRRFYNYGNPTVNLDVMHTQIILLLGFSHVLDVRKIPMAWQRHEAQHPYTEPRETVRVRTRTREQGV